MTSVKIIKIFAGSFAFGVVGSITFLDKVGYLASVEGRSMQPTLNPCTSNSRDVVFLNRKAIENFKIERGEVVSLLSPSRPDELLIKRVIALEGDTIRTLRYKNRYVTVPEGHCWIEGDNVKSSVDSNNYGPVSLGLIRSKASVIIWPPNRIQTLKKTMPPNRLIPESKSLNHLGVTGMEDDGEDTIDMLQI